MSNDIVTNPTIGVINPYPLAEMTLGRRVDWKNTDVRATLEEAFGMPYEQLFDPKYGSPLYAGFELDGDGNLVDLDPGEIELPDNPIDVPRLSDSDLSNVETVADVAEVGSVENAEDLSVQQSKVSGPNRIQLDVELPDYGSGSSRLAGIPENLHELVVDVGSSGDAWNPSDINWSDPGRFFNETAEFLDPIQGAVGDCYLIAALGAVAWSDPSLLSHRTRATGETQQEFVDVVEFYDGNGSTDVEVTEALPRSASNGGAVYARSSENNEIWPAVYEKAYAKWKTGTASDKPKIPSIAGGDPVGTTVELTGKNSTYYGTANHSATDLWDTIRSHSRSYRTFDPMTAWTYCSADQAPDDISYSDNNVVACHAYTVLGWDYDYSNDTRYVVLRNPWGLHEENGLGGKWWSYDQSFWRDIDYSKKDGVFAIEASTFEKYYAGLGVAE